MSGGGPRPGHAPTNGLAKEIWNMDEEERRAALARLSNNEGAE